MQNCDFTASAVHFAARQNNCILLKELKKLGANMSIPNACGNTPLHIAARFKSLKALRFLAQDSTCDVNTVNLSGATPLFEAIDAAHVEGVKCLVQFGADVNLEQSYRNVTPLQCAFTNIVKRDSCSGASGTRLTSSRIEIFKCLIPLSSKLQRRKGRCARVEYMPAPNDAKRMVELLLLHGAQPEEIEPSLFPFLCDDSLFDLVRLNIRSQRFLADLNLVYSQGPTSIYEANGIRRGTSTNSAQSSEVNGNVTPPIVFRRSLQEVCCGVIRQQVRKPLWKGIDTLPLPEPLKDLLKLKHFV